VISRSLDTVSHSKSSEAKYENRLGEKARKVRRAMPIKRHFIATLIMKAMLSFDKRV
jgi:hypothetical protein